MKATAQPIFDWPLFRRRAELNTFGQIILWWELRRIPFNLVVGLIGTVTCFAVFGTLVLVDNGFGGSIVNHAMVFRDSMLIEIFCYGIAANICYTGGWIVEIIAKKFWNERATHLGENSFALGVLFSSFLTLLPALLWQCFVYFILLVLFLNHK